MLAKKAKSSNISNGKSTYTKPIINKIGLTERIQAAAYGQVTESGSSGYYVRSFV